MPVKVKCSGCSTVLNVPDRARGKAVKCPKCGKGVRVPAESGAASGSATRRKKPAPTPAASDFDDDPFGGFDLGHLEDRSTRVCPKCGTIVGEEDVDCMNCGADLATGGLGVTQRARAKRKGAAPSEFYSRAMSDAREYMMKKLYLIWKSTFIVSIFAVMTVISADFYVWCHNWPTKMFWAFIGTVCFLIIPGWFWYVQNQFVLRILDTKREKYPVVFEAFSAVSLGIKSVSWTFVFGLPIWILFGGGAWLLDYLGSSGAATGFLLFGAAIFVILAVLSWSVVQAHFAMPLTWPGWLLHKVAPDVARLSGPSLYQAAVAMGFFLPVAGLVAGAVVVAYPKHEPLVETLAENSRINWAIQITADAEENKFEAPPEAADLAKATAPEINWGLLMWPAIAVVPVALASSIWMVFVQRITALFVKLFRPDIENLIAHEKEYEYKSLTPQQKEEVEKLRGPLTAYAVKSYALVGLDIAALGGVGVAMTVGKEAGYIMSLGGMFLLVGGVLNLIAFLLILVKAFRTSAMWGLAVLIPPINSIGLFLFVGQESKRTVYDFQLWVISAGFLFLGTGLTKVAEILAERSASSEGAEQALLFARAVVSLMC